MKKTKHKQHGREKEIVFDPKDILDHVRPTPLVPNKLSDDDKIKIIEEQFKVIMETLGLDLDNDSLHKSPYRIAKMYVKEIFSGLKTDNFPKMTVIENQMEYDEMIVIKDVNVMSVCEHHFATIHGRAHIAYIPEKRVIGLSKINRITKYFCRRPQVQERLTKQIADCLEYVLETPNVAVIIDAAHYCVISRGIEDINSSTMTSDLRGSFKEDLKTRSEFMEHIQHNLRK